MKCYRRLAAGLLLLLSASCMPNKELQVCWPGSPPIAPENVLALAALRQTEADQGWLFFAGGETAEEYRTGSFFKGYTYEVRNRVRPNLIGFRYFDPELRFHVPCVPGPGNGRFPGIAAFSFSPNGKRLAFIVRITSGTPTSVRKLFLWDANKTEPAFVRELSPRFPSGSFRPVAVSPIDDRIALVLPGNDGAPNQLVIIGSKSGDERILATTVRGGLNWRGDGRRIMYQTETPKGEAPVIMSVDVETGSTTVVARGRFPVVSNDGSRMVFDHEGLSLLDLKTRQEKRVSDEWGALGSPVPGVLPLWSPDDRFIWFATWGKQFAQGNIVNLDTRTRLKFEKSPMVNAWGKIDPRFQSIAKNSKPSAATQALWNNVVNPDRPITAVPETEGNEVGRRECY